jgi:3-methyladenine DNA glycosylase AlkD
MLFDFSIRRAFEKEFFTRKAIGWALRYYSYSAPDSVASFLMANRNTLSGLSFREGAKALVRKGWAPSE